jgi:hypothetical protein
MLIRRDMKDIGLDIMDEGDVSDFLGVKEVEKKAGPEVQQTIHLTQPHLIDSIFEDLQLDNKTTSSKMIPMSSSKILFRDSNSKP